MIKQKIEQIRGGKLSAEDNITYFINKIKKDNPKINSVLHVNPDAVKQAIEIDKKIKNGKKAGKLAGIGFIVKSNINVKGLIINCASKTLENYKGTYNASVIDRLLKEDAIIIGMSNMDEFACGSSGETSAFGFCKNPRSIDRIPGGSSSGSAASVAADFCDFSLGSDTGGSIRNPASHCGVVGYKPSYGAVSRYGLIDLAMSFDQIGPLANDVQDCQIIFDIIKGKDENDPAAIDYKSEKKDSIKIGILEVKGDKKIIDKIKNKTEKVSKDNKYNYDKISLNNVDLGIQTYYPIVYVEFFSGTRKFDGRKYGKKIEDSAGVEVLRRIVGGGKISKAEFAGKYYRRALTAKRIIEEEFNNAFKKVDIIIMPTVPKLPHKIGEKISVEDMYNYDTLTVLANIAQIPAISIPCGEIEGLPVGLQILAKKGNDDFLLDISKKFE